MKICSKCSAEKQFCEFNKRAASKDGHSTICRECEKANKRKYYLENSEKIKEKAAKWYSENPERAKESSKKWRTENAEYKRAMDAKWRAENLESKRANDLAWAAANPEKVNANNKRWRDKNKEQMKAIRKNWEKENPEARRSLVRNARSRRRNAEGKHTKADIEKLFFLQKGKCASCTKKLFKSGENVYHVDHIVALSRGGSNWPDNLQLLYPLCNSRKHAKDPFDWANENGKLL